MKETIFRYARSIRVRIISAFLAFLIFALTFQQAFVGWEFGVRVSAAGDGNIHSATTEKTSIYTSAMNTRKALTGNSAYTYTGKYTNDNITTLFDYLSDYELGGGTYNVCQQNEDNYVDVYKNLNRAISDNAITNVTSVTKTSPASDNVTIVFSSSNFPSTGVANVHLWDDDYHATTWPGPSMEYDYNICAWKYTYSTTKSDSNNYLDFTPTHLKFSPNGATGTKDLDKELTPGSTYYFSRDGYYDTNYNKIGLTFKCPSGTFNNDNVFIYLWDNNNRNNGNFPGFSMTKSTNNDYDYYSCYSDFVPTNYILSRGANSSSTNKYINADLSFPSSPTLQIGYVYTFTVSKVSPYPTSVETDTFDIRNAEPFTYQGYTHTDIYTNPLYFGTFLMDPAGTSAPEHYTDTNRPNYNNFYWQANMGLKPADSKGTASVKGLVKNTLSGVDDNNSAGNLLDVNSPNYDSEHPENQIQLPYFDKSSSLFTGGLMRYYDKDTDGGNLTFPFYEVYKSAATNDEYERYYQFDSREANLLFNINNPSDADDHTGYFSENSLDVYRGYWSGSNFITNTIKSDRSNVGFFPFNSTNTQNGTTNNHNLGFGLKFQMDFQLEDDGCVSAMKLESGELKPKDGASRVPTIFEFTGDDDLWVFVDGNLMLDMGGDHNKSHGIINFHNKTVTVDKATTFGTDGNNNLGATVTDNASQFATTAEFISKLSGTNFTGVNSNKYDTNETHTLTVFYMERGMMDSNLSIRYNYSPIANTSRMKIAEVTKFDNVNAGLLTATQQAAEDDVFKYTVTNTIPTGVTIVNPLDSGAKYPITTEYTRTAEGNSSWTTQLTHTLSNTTPVEKKFTTGALDAETYVKDTAYWWVDGFSNTDYLVGKTTNSSGSDPGGDLWLMYGTNDSVYDSSNTGKESSAEFEKQFSPDSTMKVVQGTNIYRLSRSNNTAMLFDSSGNIQATEDSNRAVSTYYTTQYRLVDRNGNEIFDVDSATYNATGAGNQNSSFTFANHSSVSSHFAVMLTEYVENTINVGAISVTKNVNSPSGVTDGETDNSDRFEFTVQFTDVFGVSGVTVDDYTDITVTGNAKDSNGADITKLLSGGKFYLKKGDTATISGIPVGTKYTITETTNTNYEASGSVTTAKTIANGTVSGTTYTPSSVTETIINTRLTGSLKLVKAEGTNWAANGITPSTQFRFTVTLTKPSTISFDNFKAYFSDFTSYTPDSSAGTLTRTFNVVKGTNQTISDIPYGTHYSVTETNAQGATSQITSNTSGTIGNGTVTATITNNYPAVQNPISLDIEKVEQGATDTKLSGATFDLYYSPEAQSTAATSTPVLSGTGSVQYEWTESTADNKLRLTLPTGWSSANLTAKFYNSGSLVSSNSMEGDTGSIYKVSVPASTYDSVVFSDSTNTSSSISLNEGNNYGKNYICALTTNSSYSAGSNKVAFDNTGTGWSAVYAYMWNSSNDTQKNANYPGVRITENSNGIYIAEITDNSYDRIIFNSGNNSNGGQSDSPKTLNLDLTSNVGKVFHPRISDRLMIKSGDINEGNDGQRKANYWTGSVNTQITGNSWDREYNGMTGNSRYGDSFEVPSNNYSSLQIYRRKDNDDTQDKWRSVTFTLNSTNNYGRGQVYKLRKASSSNNIVFEYLGIGSPDYADSGYWDNTATVWDINTYSGVSTTDCTATYQPEDRYSEANNDIYITVPDSITSPYVKFLDSSNALIGSATNGILLNGTDMKLNGTSHGVVSATDTTNSTTTYRIRLPKNAASFKVNNGDIYTLNDDAGAKFTVDPSTNAITRTAQRDGYDTTKPALTTDSYISFKDVNNEWNGTVFAYYFGGTNGEYSEWQGVSPFKSYTSGSDTIYVFQYPEGGTNDYPKVIFNSGAYPSSSNKTSAIQYEAGKIYASTSTTVTNFTPDSSQTGSWVKLATVETGIGGTIGKITWLKEPSSIDTDYLANTSDDIWDDSHTNRIDILVKVKKTGTYIWKETNPPTGYNTAPDTVFIVTDSDRGNSATPKSITIADPKTPDPSTNEIILTKTAKEQVGEKAIGVQLKGAAFKLVKIQTSSNDETLRFNKTASVTDTNEYIYVSSGGTYNASGSWLTTGDDGRLHIKNLPNGDYYLEEQTAPSGFVNTDSNNNGDPKRVYFSVGENTGTKNITCSDEMDPAYIRLFEHINEKKTAWGNPTFIFKITQTGYYDYSDSTPSITPVSNGKQMIVALTVNDDDVIAIDNILNNTTYNGWYVERTNESEYQGMYHIDSQGRIRVEPGTYQITRVPVSRYKFVTSAYSNQYTNGGNPTSYTENKSGDTPQETVTISALEAGKTIDVHYYDTVEYYDKFSHVDTKVNKFYQLDENTKKNKTVKGIRVKDITNVGTSSDTTINVTGNSDFKLYFIYVDGTESEITEIAEKAKLIINYSGTDTTFGDSTNGFSFTSPNITIKANTNFKDKVYTLNATYDSKFTTTFDLVFERTT